ncbi:AsnC family transcriptional regulator [Actinomyces minihominis]|uniref:AsnC family transcriptional regulator n=1 Tax=Actinomyces minihominis TaxID=2002838 RepID=UPI000C07D106|nr:AsnC family transcriptional regulator [Actinomyces minihominis]
MTPERFDAEVRLFQAIAFVDTLLERGILTTTEADTARARLARQNRSLVGSLLLQVRLDNRGV